jgi:hypothetical protein
MHKHMQTCIVGCKGCTCPISPPKKLPPTGSSRPWPPPASQTPLTVPSLAHAPSSPSSPPRAHTLPTLPYTHHHPHTPPTNPRRRHPPPPTAPAPQTPPSNSTPSRPAALCARSPLGATSWWAWAVGHALTPVPSHAGAYRSTCTSFVLHLQLLLCTCMHAHQPASQRRDCMGNSMKTHPTTPPSHPTPPLAGRGQQSTRPPRRPPGTNQRPPPLHPRPHLQLRHIRPCTHPPVHLLPALQIGLETRAGGRRRVSSRGRGGGGGGGGRGRALCAGPTLGGVRMQPGGRQGGMRAGGRASGGMRPGGRVEACEALALLMGVLARVFVFSFPRTSIQTCFESSPHSSLL